jgi:hypothetical protein
LLDFFGNLFDDFNELFTLDAVLIAVMIGLFGAGFNFDTFISAGIKN